MSLKKNILANYIGTGVVALAPILALPWYLAALGPQQFGLIGFVVMWQAVLGLLDAGMSQALVREFALRFKLANGERRSTAVLLFGFERIYWVFAIGSGCVTALLANGISSHWLNLGDLPVATGRTAIYGAAAIFIAQFPGSVYRSLLVGAQAQVALNGVMFCGALLRHVGGVIVVIHWSTLTSYLIWNALIALLETIVRGRLAWSILGVKRNQVDWDKGVLLPVLSMVVGMSGATWLGALTVQMDRIVLSRMAPVEQFGYYTLAATAAMGVLQLIYPLLQAILPRAVQLRDDPRALRQLNFKLARLIGLLAGLAALVFTIGGEWLLRIWLRDPQAVAAVYPLLSILLVGTALNAFSIVGYINWVVHEQVRRLFLVNALSLGLSVLLIPLLVSWKGAIGATFGWLMINLIGFTLSLGWLKRKYD